MEALSGAASGIAVVSLSIQLIECIGSIKTFIRNVKDAQKELERLVDLLERLEALLEDVRALMERQASLEHFPTPSATILKCLKSCEKTLEPLQAIVDKCTPSKSKASTSMDRLKNGLRMGFKTKDVQDLEARVEREVNFLHASLGANCGAILLQFGPALLKSPSNHETIHQGSTELTSVKAETAGISSNEGDTMLSNMRATHPSVSIIPISSRLERLGIYQRKIVQCVPCTSGERVPGSKDGDETIVSETHETTLLWSILGHGLTWIQRQSFGRVVPSLSIFPTVKRFPNEIRSVFYDGKTQDFQDMLHRGVIHPFSRDHMGRSLLHVAGEYQRADIYLLLRNLGLKQNASIYGETPLSATLMYDTPFKKADPITIYRYSLEDLDVVDNPISYDWEHIDFSSCHSDSTIWMYKQSAEILPREDSCVIRARAVWDSWKLLCAQHYHNWSDFDNPGFDLDEETLNFLKQRNNPLLSRMFDECWGTYDSFVLGEIFLGWISTSGIDVEQFINQEVEIANASDVWDSCSKRIVFETCNGGWRLGFEFAFDREASGYLLASEFEALFGFRWVDIWPFDEHSFHSTKHYDERRRLREMRFQRRMAAKARKQSGQKKPKSRMPGAWVH